MASFYCSEYLKGSMESGDIQEIRNALLAYVDVDPAFKDHMFQDAIDYVTKRGFVVYETHDPGLFAEEGIPEDQFYKIKTDLFSNFSRERVLKLIDVGSQCMKDASIYKMTKGPAYTQTSQTEPAASKEVHFSKAGGQNQRANPRAMKVTLAVILAAIIFVLIIVLIHNHRKI